MEDVYKKLALHLDNTPSGYPATESGVELRILKQLFTREEAELALSLVLMLEPVEEIAKRAAESTKVGDPMAGDTVMGPVVSEMQFNKIQGLIESEKEKIIELDQSL